MTLNTWHEHGRKKTTAKSNSNLLKCSNIKKSHVCGRRLDSLLPLASMSISNSLFCRDISNCGHKSKKKWNERERKKCPSFFCLFLFLFHYFTDNMQWQSNLLCSSNFISICWTLVPDGMSRKFIVFLQEISNLRRLENFHHPKIIVDYIYWMKIVSLIARRNHNHIFFYWNPFTFHINLLDDERTNSSSNKSFLIKKYFFLCRIVKNWRKFSS